MLGGWGGGGGLWLVDEGNFILFSDTLMGSLCTYAEN